jgi:hypothetical protein
VLAIASVAELPSERDDCSKTESLIESSFRNTSSAFNEF